MEFIYSKQLTAQGEKISVACCGCENRGLRLRCFASLGSGRFVSDVRYPEYGAIWLGTRLADCRTAAETSRLSEGPGSGRALEQQGALLIQIHGRWTGID